MLVVLSFLSMSDRWFEIIQSFAIAGIGIALLLHYHAFEHKEKRPRVRIDLEAKDIDVEKIKKYQDEHKVVL